MKNLLIGAAIATLAMTTYMTPTVSAEDIRRETLTCNKLHSPKQEIEAPFTFHLPSQEVEKTYTFTVGEIEPNWNFIVKRVAIGQDGWAYVYLENPENDNEHRELYWSNGWKCLIERYVKND